MSIGLDSLTDRASILANEQGTLTGTQRDLLRLTSGVTFWYALGTAVVITGIVVWAMNTQMADLPANAPPIPNYFWIVLGIAIGAPLLYLGGQMVRASRIKREIASGGIAAEEGQVEWTGRSYRVAASVRGLRSVYGPVNLMPGHYRFYLLPGSRYLLSADPQDAPETSCAALTGILGQVFGFTRDDLAANREGRISPAQAARLRTRAIQTGILALVILAVLAGAFFLAFTLQTTWYLVSFGLWSLLSLFVLPSMIHSTMNQLRERHAAVTSVLGSGSKNFRYASRSVLKSYTISGKSFDVSGRAYDAMVEGTSYRLYYTLIGEAILSIEAIPPDSPSLAWSATT